MLKFTAMISLTKTESSRKFLLNSISFEHLTVDRPSVAKLMKLSTPNSTISITLDKSRNGSTICELFNFVIAKMFQN